MPADLSDRMLSLLADRKDSTTQITIADFARAFGANRELIVLHAQHLVDSGAVLGSHVNRHGRPTLYALRLRPPNTA